MDRSTEIFRSEDLSYSDIAENYNVSTILEALKADAFKASIGSLTSPKALRRSLLHRPEVASVREALRNGHISEGTIERFVDSLMADFQRGTQFPHELALAALACALDGRRTEFAYNYLLDLARLQKFSELDIAPKIGGQCLQEWSRAAKVRTENFKSSNRLTRHLRANRTHVEMRIVTSQTTVLNRSPIVLLRKGE